MSCAVPRPGLLGPPTPAAPKPRSGPPLPEPTVIPHRSNWGASSAPHPTPSVNPTSVSAKPLSPSWRPRAWFVTGTGLSEFMTPLSEWAAESLSLCSCFWGHSYLGSSQGLVTRRATMREKAKGRFILSTPQFLQGCVGPWGRRTRTRSSAVDTSPGPGHSEQRSPSRRPGEAAQAGLVPNTQLSYSDPSGANRSRPAVRGRPTVHWAGWRTVRLDPVPPRGPSGCRGTGSRGAPLRTLDTHLPAARFQGPGPGTTRPLRTYLCRVAGGAQVTNLSEQLAQRRRAEQVRKHLLHARPRARAVGGARLGP